MISIGRESRPPMKMRATPDKRPNSIAVETASDIAVSSLLATSLAMSTLAPVAHPTKRFMMRFIKADVEPTAASATEPANLPATAISEALKSCCSMLLNAIGMAKAISLFQMEPLSISMPFSLVRIPITA